jgi:hypothetical protein
MNPDILDSAHGPDGSLTVVFVDDAESVILRVDIGEGTAYVDELFLRHLVMLTADVGVPGAAFVIRRSDAQPRRTDRRLWHELSTRLAESSTELLDLVVVGDDEWWSAASGRTSLLRNEIRLSMPRRADVEDDPVRLDVGEVRLVRHEDPATEELNAGRGVPQHG